MIQNKKIHTCIIDCNSYNIDNIRSIVMSTFNGITYQLCGNCYVLYAKLWNVYTISTFETPSNYCIIVAAFFDTLWKTEETMGQNYSSLITSTVNKQGACRQSSENCRTAISTHDGALVDHNISRTNTRRIRDESKFSTNYINFYWVCQNSINKHKNTHQSIHGGRRTDRGTKHSNAANPMESIVFL